MENKELKAVDLRIMSGLKTGAFIDSPEPVLSWRLEGGAGIMQSACRIVAASAAERLEKPDQWDSGRIESGNTLYWSWGGNPLESRRQVFWRVKVWDQDGRESGWSDVSHFETALYRNNDWEAEWIHFDGNNPSHSAPCPYFRKEFTTNEKVKKARLYVTARGLFAVRLNGSRVGDDYFVPGWTDFMKQTQYMAYDVTPLLREGLNTIGAVLGDGWYCGYLSGRQRNLYGQYPELLAQLEVIYDDGTVEKTVSDGSWRTATGPILYSDIYDGEMYDARLEMPGWDRNGFDDSSWRPAVSGGRPETLPELVLKCCPPVRRIVEMKPVNILNPRPDVYIWDLGQNISGRVRVKLKGYAGRLYTINFGEMLNRDGTLYNLNYRSARCTDYYICKGDRENGEVWEPEFTFHGFRYVEIDSFMFSGATVEDIEVTGIVMYSDLNETGDFRCSDAMVNQLYSNIRWGQRDNFFEIPTDCPQRDERLGWTGDAQIFARTACLNMDVNAFFEKWLRDVREAQREDGAVSCIAPNILQFGYGASAWADAVVICPWAIYRAYGNRNILSQNYDAMKKWIGYQENTSDNLIFNGEPFGDWLALSAVETPLSLIGTAYFAYTAGLTGEIAKVLGHMDDAEYYAGLSGRIKNAFNREYIDGCGKLKIATQTACVLALQFDLLKPDDRQINAELLESLIRQAGNKLTTGFVGTGLIMPALTACGKTRIAYDLLCQQEFPSWLFSVKQGATTIWERWNSYTVEEGFGDVNMNSFNHYSYGAVAEWMIGTVLGINVNPDGGIVFSAIPDRRLKWAKGHLMTPFGLVESSWCYKGKSWHWEISSPPNTRMKVHVSGDGKIMLNGKTVSSNILELKNGRYAITLIEYEDSTKEVTHEKVKIYAH